MILIAELSDVDVNHNYNGQNGEETPNLLKVNENSTTDQNASGNRRVVINTDIEDSNDQLVNDLRGMISYIVFSLSEN